MIPAASLDAVMRTLADPTRRAVLERAVGQKLALAPWRFERDALHER